MIARSFLARCIAETPDNRYFGQENAAGEYAPHGGAGDGERAEPVRPVVGVSIKHRKILWVLLKPFVLAVVFL